MRSAYACSAAVAAVLLALFLLSFSPGGGWASPALQPTVNVSVLDYRFDPQDLMVLTGTRVVWTNSGIAPHTTTSGGALWDSGMISGGGTYSRTFDSPGAYPYYCSFHQFQGMAGTITVVAATSQVYLPSLAKNATGW